MSKAEAIGCVAVALGMSAGEMRADTIILAIAIMGGAVVYNRRSRA